MGYDDDFEKREHESYGMVSFSRYTTAGKNRLFGSALDNHHVGITLKISRAEWNHGLHRDWYHPKKKLIEVDLSAAQFAELLTTMNAGCGVPCTLRYVGQVKMEAPSDVDSTPEQIRKNFKKESGQLVSEVSSRSEKIAGLISGMSKKRRSEVMGHLKMIEQHIQSNMPFALSSFQEATENVLTTTKAEAEAFLTHAVQAAGLKHLQEEDELKSLPATALEKGGG